MSITDRFRPIHGSPSISKPIELRPLRKICYTRNILQRPFAISKNTRNQNPNFFFQPLIFDYSHTFSLYSGIQKHLSGMEIHDPK
jgi:hypothetical protein